MTKKPINQYIDQTNIRTDARRQDIINTCKEAKDYQFRGVCVRPKWVKTAAKELKGTGVKVIALIDDPIGLSEHRKRMKICKQAKADGADELDVVVSIPDVKMEGGKWSVSKVIKDAGADAVYGEPAKRKIERYQTTLWASVIGSRGTLLPPMDEKDNKRRSMQLLKAKFRSVETIFSSKLKIAQDGTFTAELDLPSNAAPGKYFILAKVDKELKSSLVTVENKVTFPKCLPV